jgi:hypothetical protein
MPFPLNQGNMGSVPHLPKDERQIPQGGEADMEERDFQRIEEMMTRMMGQFRGEIGADFRHQLGLHRKDFQHKLDLVVEGQNALAERMDRMEGRMGRLENRVDGIAIDLSAHRRDTEAHRKGWRVREEEGGE